MKALAEYQPVSCWPGGCSVVTAANSFFLAGSTYRARIADMRAFSSGVQGGGHRFGFEDLGLGLLGLRFQTVIPASSDQPISE
jgi:hypothetical protein